MNVPASGTRSATDVAEAEFASIVGDSRVTSEPATCESFAVDGQAPKYVVYPSSAEQVAAALKCAQDLDLAVIPCRNLTKIGIGNPPRRYDVALSLKEMNRVWYYEPADLVISVEPGIKLSDFQRFVWRHRLWLPLDPPGGARTSIGGILAANASGPLRTAYGGPRDMVLGMKVATTEGKIVKTGGRVVKNVTGYDIAKLLIGSYGTLGVIVEASFKLYPQPAERATFVVPLASLDAARELRRRIQQSHLQPLRMLLMDGATAGAARVFSPWGKGDPSGKFELWIEAGGSAKVIERYARELDEMTARERATVERLGGGSAGDIWGRIADFRTEIAQSFPDAAILRASLPIASGEEFLGRAHAEADSGRLWRASFAQPSLGIVHFCLRSEAGAPDVLAVAEKLREAADSLGGTLVVERCPHQIKPQIDAWGPAGDDFEIMRKVKQRWDPKGILSPGRFVGGL